MLARARWPQIAVFLAALFAVDLIRNYSYRGWTLETFLGEEIVLAVLGVAFGIGGGSVAGTLVAEALPLRGAARALATVILALVGAALAMGAVALWWPTGLVPNTVSESMPTSAFVLRNLWNYTAMSILLAAYFATRERDLAIARAAQVAELERGRVQRVVMEARLKVIQARVEPELLFEVLADVQRLYASAPQQAEALLDDLIVYLRAALPQMRGNASSLGREAALAQAFLKVTQRGRGGSIACVNRIAPELDDLPFPPMVLLPLVHAAADACAPRLVLDATAHPGDDPTHATVSVTVTVPSGVPMIGWQNDRLSVPREIVGSYFGAGTTLDATVQTEGVTATICFKLPQSLVAPRTGSESNAAVPLT